MFYSFTFTAENFYVVLSFGCEHNCFVGCCLCMCGCVLAEFQSGRVHVISAPKDAVVALGSDISIDCTVDALGVGDSLTWWFQTADSITRLFLSHGIEPGDMNLIDAMKYAIEGHYNLLVKSAEFSDAGVYVCEITGHGNYTAEVSVLGKSPLCDDFGVFKLQS